MEEKRNTKPLPDNVSHYKQLQSSAYLGHWSIPEGKAIKVTIDHLMLEEVFNTGNNKREWKTVIHFKGSDKGMILNGTNSDAIASHYGSNPKEWPGKEIELERKMVKLRKDMVEAIRVKPKSKSATATASAQ